MTLVRLSVPVLSLSAPAKMEKEALEHMPHEWALPAMEASAATFLKTVTAKAA